MMLQQEIPEDFVIATGAQFSVRDFVISCAEKLQLELEWVGEGVNEVAYWNDRPDGIPVVAVDPRYFRPAEVETLLGDASKAKQKLGWEPEISFDQLVDEMIAADLKTAKKELASRS